MRIDDLFLSSGPTRNDDTEPKGRTAQRNQPSISPLSTNDIQKLPKPLQRDKADSLGVDLPSTKTRPSLAWLDSRPPQSGRSAVERPSGTDDVPMSNFPSPSALLGDDYDGDPRSQSEPNGMAASDRRQLRSHLDTPSGEGTWDADSGLQVDMESDPFFLGDDYTLDFPVSRLSPNDKSRGSPSADAQRSLQPAAGEARTGLTTGMEVGFHENMDDTVPKPHQDEKDILVQSFLETDQDFADMDTIANTSGRKNPSPDHTDLPHAKRRRTNDDVGLSQTQYQPLFWSSGQRQRKIAKTRPFKDMTGIDLNLPAEFEDIADFVD